jgi:phosphoribosylaminoimidazole-succinocarboxamide synthase
MLDQSYLQQVLPAALAGVDLPFLGEKRSGKVRDLYTHGDLLILITTDRLSAFDRNLGLVPFKGQVLNQLTAWWFAQTQQIIGNHLIAIPDPNVTIARYCRPLPVEVVVRGFITGVTKTSLWHEYERGERQIYGIDFPDGLRKNDPLPTPILTPTTKGAQGQHDERITAAQVTELGLATPDQWDRIGEAALALFAFGQRVAARAGLILVDTKYEFGVDADGEVVLIDEVHTPDSSRFWRAESYAVRHAAGEEPENFDKELIRLYYAAHGYRGEGEPMPLPAELAVQAAQRYITIDERLTGKPFEPGELPAAARIERNMHKWLPQPPSATPAV